MSTIVQAVISVSTWIKKTTEVMIIDLIHTRACICSKYYYAGYPNTLLFAVTVWVWPPWSGNSPKVYSRQNGNASPKALHKILHMLTKSVHIYLNFLTWWLLLKTQRTHDILMLTESCPIFPSEWGSEASFSCASYILTKQLLDILNQTCNPIMI